MKSGLDAPADEAYSSGTGDKITTIIRSDLAVGVLLNSEPQYLEVYSPCGRRFPMFMSRIVGKGRKRADPRDSYYMNTPGCRKGIAIDEGGIRRS